MHAAVLLALVAAQMHSHVEPERIVRVQLLPVVAEPAPGPKAPEAVAPPPAPRPPPPARPKADTKPRVAKPPPPKPIARKIVTPALAPAPTPDPVALTAADTSSAAPAEPAAGSSIAAVSSAPPRGAGGHGPGGGDELSAYVARVRALLASHQVYPSLARRRGLEGDVLLRLRIGADGRIEDAHADGAAQQIFARSAIDATERVGRFPAPPQGALSIEVPMRFRLEDD